jgi:hypothetical protein
VTDGNLVLKPRPFGIRSLCVMRSGLRIAAFALFVMGSVGVGSANATATPPPADQAERQFFDRLNAERTARGLSILVRDNSLDALARDWSGQMASETNLHHRPDLATRIAAIEPAWQRGGENVGYGGDVESLHTAFMNSPKHYENIVGAWNRLGVGVVERGGTIWVTFNFLKGPALTASLSNSEPAAAAGDLWLATADGTVWTLGSAPSYGDRSGHPLNAPIVGLTATPTGHGYWLVASDGGVFAFGDAVFLGSMGGQHLNAPIVGMGTTPGGHGYWLVGSDGGIFAFGDATFYGSTGGLPLNRPITGMSGTADGRGYWLVASDGGVFAFGDAGFFGSLGGQIGGPEIVAVATSPAGDGYWMLGRDGTVAGFGGAPTLGDTGVAGAARIAATADGLGYRVVQSDGRVHLFGTAGSGVSSSLGLRSPIVGIAQSH